MGYHDYSVAWADDLASCWDKLKAADALNVLPKTLKALDRRCLGSGCWGSVYGTRSRRWLLKVTADNKEARLAALAAKHYAAGGEARRAVMAGMVGFGGIVQVAPETNLYVVYRERAERLGKLVEKDIEALSTLIAYEDYTRDAAEAFDMHGAQGRMDLWRDVLEQREGARYRKLRERVLADAERLDLNTVPLGGFGCYCKGCRRDEGMVSPLEESSCVAGRIGKHFKVELGDSAWNYKNRVGAFVAASLLMAEAALVASRKIKRIGGLVKTLQILANSGAFIQDFAWNFDNVGYVQRRGRRAIAIVDARALALGVGLETYGQPVVEIQALAA